jgi:hypothetical protein
VNIRKIIKEEIAKLMDKRDLENKFDQDIVYLKGFSLNKKEDKENMSVWVFDHKEKDYTLRFYIQKNKKNESWNAKVFIYWKIPTKEFTNAKGKDFEHSFGPFNSYEEMVKELNRKLANNPLISLESYLDDDNTQFDKDLVKMTELLLKHGKQLETVKDGHFNDLKKIYNKIKNIKSIDELKKYLNEKAPNEEDKQTLLLILQKVYQLDFYLKKEQLESLF